MYVHNMYVCFVLIYSHCMCSTCTMIMPAWVDKHADMRPKLTADLLVVYQFLQSAISANMQQHPHI